MFNQDIELTESNQNARSAFSRLDMSRDKVNKCRELFAKANDTVSEYHSSFDIAAKAIRTTVLKMTGTVPKNLIPQGFDFSHIIKPDDVFLGLLFSDTSINSNGNIQFSSTKLWYASAVSEFLEKFYNVELRWYLSNNMYKHDEHTFSFYTRGQNKINKWFKKLRQEWYPHGKKIIPQTFKPTAEIMNAAWCGDGSIANNQGELCTNSFSIKDVDRVCQQLSSILGIHIKYSLRKSTKTKKKTQPVIKFSSDAVQAFLNYIGPTPAIPGFEFKFLTHSLVLGKAPISVRAKSLLIKDESLQESVRRPEDNVQQAMQDIAWVSDLINNCGSLRIIRNYNRNGNPCYMPMIRISSPDKDRVFALAQHLKLVSVKQTEPKINIPTLFKFEVRGRSVVQLIKKVYPYLSDEFQLRGALILSMPLGKGQQDLKKCIHEMYGKMSKALRLQRLNVKTILENDKFRSLMATKVDATVQLSS